MTQSDFVDWKRHPVTQQVLAQLVDRVNQLTENIITDAGLYPHVDARNAGAIQAYRDVLEITYEDTNGS